MGPNGNGQKPARIRVNFWKTEPMRFTSHLDLYRAWERLLRRAGVQLVFSQGYNPRPKLQLAAPLVLGITSRAEIIDFWLEYFSSSLDKLKTHLVDAQPPGIEIQTLERIDPAAPPLQKKVVSAKYHVALMDRVPQIGEKVNSILAAESLIRSRRDKSYDLRPLILELSVENAEQQLIQMLLDAQEGSTGRPEEVLLALGIPPENTRIERTQLVIQNSSAG